MAHKALAFAKWPDPTRGWDKLPRTMIAVAICNLAIVPPYRHCQSRVELSDGGMGFVQACTCLLAHHNSASKVESG
eukprot:scaffold7832_cov164-Amphora_coffeaeformis.AAC.1